MNISAGITVAVLAGAINGLFALPGRLARHWSWENVWLPFSLLGMAVFPAWTTLVAVPRLGAAYSSLGAGALLLPFFWGMTVYTGSLMFGVSLTHISSSLAFALLVGAMSVVGVAGPIAAFHPEVLGQAAGMWILAGVGCLLAAMAFCALAGTWKARAQAGQSTATMGSKTPASPVKGMLLATIGGVLSGLLSLGMSMEWARRVVEAAIREGGARPENAANAVLLPILLGGSIPNCLYCLYLLRRNKTWNAYRAGARYWLVILLMAVMYSGSVVLWGVSTSPAMLGPLGASVGWALFIGMIVIASNIGGFLAGEWRGAGGRASGTMACGLGLIVAAMVCIGFGNYLLNA